MQGSPRIKAAAEAPAAVELPSARPTDSQANAVQQKIEANSTPEQDAGVLEDLKREIAALTIQGRWRGHRRQQLSTRAAAQVTAVTALIQDSSDQAIAARAATATVRVPKVPGIAAGASHSRFQGLPCPWLVAVIHMLSFVCF